MCKKYVNISTKCYKSITIVNNNIMSYNIPFSSIRCENDDKGIYINDFNIVTDINFLGTNNKENKKENPLENKTTLDFIVRLTRCSNDEKKRIGYDLESFSVNLAEMHEMNQVDKACFDFLNYTRITKVDKLYLPVGAGKYVIKILIKDSLEDEYTIQTMSQLVVVD